MLAYLYRHRPKRLNTQVSLYNQDRAVHSGLQPFPHSWQIRTQTVSLIASPIVNMTTTYAPPGESPSDLWLERSNLVGSVLGGVAYGIRPVHAASCVGSPLTRCVYHRYTCCRICRVPLSHPSSVEALSDHDALQTLVPTGLRLCALLAEHSQLRMQHEDDATHVHR